MIESDTVHTLTEMSLSIGFILLVALGAFVQTVSGFAMGLIIIAGATLLGLEEIAFSAAVISIISLVNSTVALRTSYDKVDRGYLKWMAAALVPGLLAGLLLLDYLSHAYEQALRLMLGMIVIIAGVMLMTRPSSYNNRSRPATTLGFGLLGGVIGGLFSAGGASFAYHLYRQPAEVSAIRATLLAVLVVSTSLRTAIITAAGLMTVEIVVTSLLSVPVVVLVTDITSRLLVYIPDRAVRILVATLMTVIGVYLALGELV